MAVSERWISHPMGATEWEVQVIPLQSVLILAWLASLGLAFLGGIWCSLSCMPRLRQLKQKMGGWQKDLGQWWQWVVEFQQVIWEDEMKGQAGVEGEKELPLSPMRPPTTIATSPTTGNSDRTSWTTEESAESFDQLEKRVAKEANESKELKRGKGPKDIRVKAVAKGARAKAHGRSNTPKNERGGLTVEEEIEVSDSEEVKPNDKKTKGGKGSNMKKAIELAKDPRRMMKAKTNFKKRFLAFNTMQSRNSKRRKVLEVLQGITGLEDPFPVNQELLIGVGTALDEAQLQSGDQYAHEVKLMQLEAGYEWTMPMERQLYLVKNALKRHKGPETRASEVKLEDIKEETWEKKVNGTVSHLRPAWSYAFACIWMLRAAEVARVKAKDVMVNFDTKEVVLYNPSSKTDQRGRGAKRTLKCVCESSGCSRWCAWALAVRCLAEHRVVDPEAWLFKPAKNLKNPQKPRWWRLGTSM